MICRRAALYECEFHYEPALAVHTATSGRLTGLTGLILVIEADEDIAGLAELRINVEYLTGIAQPDMRRQVLELLSAVDWSAPIAKQANRHPSTSLCGSWRIMSRSLQVPGSPSSALTTR